MLTWWLPGCNSNTSVENPFYLLTEFHFVCALIWRLSVNVGRGVQKILNVQVAYSKVLNQSACPSNLIRD